MTSPRQTTIHPNDETSVLLSTVWLKEGDHVFLETAVFPIDEYTGEMKLRELVRHTTKHVSEMPENAAELQNAVHELAAAAYNAWKAKQGGGSPEDLARAIEQVLCLVC